MGATLEVNFLGGLGSGKAPLASIRAGHESTPLLLSERARLLLGYLALEGREPQAVKREAVQHAVFGGRPENDVDEAKDELEAALVKAGVGSVFRPYRRDASDKDRRDPRGRLCLRGQVRCDLAELLADFGSGRFSQAAARTSEIVKRQGGCQPLELVEIERADFAADESWYRDKADQLQRLIAEHRHAI